MNEPTAILVAGDCHGDVYHAAYIFQQALAQNVQAIVQVGDYGYWEHMAGGEAFLDACSEMAVLNAMPFYWLDGNHENHTMLRALYGPGGPRHSPTPEGFWTIREGVYYLPRGVRWTWNGIRMMALGGAYSVDKFPRLQAERKTERDYNEARAASLATANVLPPFNPANWKRWWPEEEITDADLAYALRDPEPVDILFTHDKPLASNPPWNRKPFDECKPNQQKIQTVVNTLNPKLLIHGHLHYRYTDFIYNGSTDGYTMVEGLDCNADAGGNPDLSWMRVELEILDAPIELSA